MRTNGPPTSNDPPPTFSVIIPTHNYAHHLPGAIRSVLTQSFDDWELIVVDDGSTDDTRAVAESFGHRVRYVSQANAGPFAAVRTGYRAGRGAWLVVFDADDRLRPRALESLHERITADPAARVVVGPWVSVSGTGRTTRDPFRPPTGDAIADFRAVLTGALRFVTGAAALHREAIRYLDEYKEPIRTGMETVAFAHLVLRERVISTTEPLLEVHDHPGRLRDSLPQVLATGTLAVGAVFDHDFLPENARAVRPLFESFLHRELGRTLYRAGCYRDARDAFRAALRAHASSLADSRNLRRWLASELRVLAGRPGLAARDRADAIARRRRDLPIPPVGSRRLLRSFRKDPVRVVTAAAATCGDVALLHLWEPTYLLSHLDDVRYVLVTRASNFRRFGLERMWRIFGSGLILDDVPSLPAQRRMAQPFYTPRASERAIAPAMASLHHITASWPAQGRINAATELLRINMGLAARTVLGIDDQPRAERIYSLVNKAHVKAVRMMHCPIHWRESWPLRRNSLYRQYAHALEREITSIIDERGPEAVHADDFLAHLLRAQRDQPSLIDPRRRLDHLKTMFAATVEPITTPTACALYRLTLHPEHQPRLLDEIDRVLGDRDPTPQDMPRLVFASMFWRETLRLHPSNWLIPRRAVADDVLPGGLRVAKGQAVMTSHYAMHHDPRYFPIPHRFDPERFSSAAIASRPRGAYMPFGAGPRACIGAALAETVGIALLVRLARDWHFSVVPGGEPVMESPNFIVSQIKDTRLLLDVRRRALAPHPLPEVHTAPGCREAARS